MDETDGLVNSDNYTDTRVAATPRDTPKAEAHSQSFVPGFDLIDELGRGGMGIVFKARQHGLNRTVALKMLLAPARLGNSDRLRFFTEAEVVAAVKHPNVVQVYEFGDADGHPYLAMEFVEGGSLARLLIERGPLPIAEASRLVEQTARGVQAAHDQGIVHRDLKPANILLSGGGKPEANSSLTPDSCTPTPLAPKVSDFGIAKRGGAADLTLTGVAMGTPAYMSPEQARGQTKFVGPGADVYALGVILYECLTGRVPFDGGDSVEVIQRVAREEPPRPRKFAPHVPVDLELICLKCLQKWPHERYPTAAALADDLSRFLAGDPVSVRPPSPVEKAAKWVRKHPTRTAAYGLTLLAIALGGIAGGAISLWRNADHARNRAVTAQGEAEIAAKNADDAKKEADEHRASAENAAKFEVAARRAAVLEKAVRDTDVAYREFASGNVAQARQLLEGCPPDYRPWEWRLVDRLCRREIFAVKATTDSVHGVGVGFTRDGTLLSSGPPGVRRWDRTSLEPTTIVPGVVREMAVSADGNRLAIVGDGQPAVYDLATWKPILNFPISFKIALDGTGRKLLYSDEQGATLLDVNTKAAARLPVTGLEAQCLTLSGDGSKAAVGGALVSKQGVVKVFPVGGKDEPSLISVNPFAAVRSVAFDPTGARLAAGCDDGAVIVYDFATRSKTRLVGHAAPVHSVAFDPTGKRLATSSADRTVRVWSADDATELLTFVGHKATVGSVVWSHDGKRLASTGLDGTIRVWDATAPPESVRLAKQTPSSLASVGPSGVLAISDDGETMALYNAGTVQVYSAKTGENRWPQAHVVDEPVVWLRVNLVRKRLTGITKGGNLLEWDLATGAGCNPDKGLPVANIGHVSDDGSRAIVPESNAPKYHIYDLLTGKAISTAGEHQAPPRRAVLSRDGKFVLTTGADGKAILWDASTGAKVRELAGHVMTVSGGAFSPDGTRVATCESEGVVKLWEVPSGRELITLRGASRGAVAVAWSPDGSKLAALDDRGVAHIWDAGPPAK